MPTDVAQHIAASPMVSTHEHLKTESDWVDKGPDILQDLFGNYVGADLYVSRGRVDGANRLMDASDPDIEGRFKEIEKAWELTQFTGYGEAVRNIASEFYGVDEITGKALAAAQEKTAELRAGGRHAILQGRANLDHVQTDDFCWACVPDASGPDFFLFDLSWAGFCNGQVDPEAIEKETGVAVTDLTSLRKGMEGLFEKYGKVAVAVKAQHAYNRTLRWEERTDGDAERALAATLKNKGEVDEATRLCLGDWGWSQGVELAIEYDLPFKLHTGYYAGTDQMPIDRVRAGNLCPLLLKYGNARFVLMHIAYPYNDELIAITKHFHNVWADLCWAWSINPYASCDFVRRFLHAAPISKLFGFGGDTGWPTSTGAYAIQARKWLTRALEGEVNDGLLSEKQAIYVADRLMIKNQYDCFDIEGTRKAIKEA
jgi:hypothetical protein